MGARTIAEKGANQSCKGEGPSPLRVGRAFLLLPVAARAFLDSQPP